MQKSKFPSVPGTPLDEETEYDAELEPTLPEYYSWARRMRERAPGAKIIRPDLLGEAVPLGERIVMPPREELEAELAQPDAGEEILSP